jgi:outer membrane protein assembly factor BamB
MLSRPILFLLTLLCAGTALAADWPVFRGNALETGVAPAPLPDPLSVIWTFKAKDAFEGTAAIQGDTVYVGSMDEHVYALALADGKVRWVCKTGSMKVPAAVKAGRVYAGDIEGVLYAIDARSGHIDWKFEAGAEITSGVNFKGDTLLFGSADENLYCLSVDGKLRWKFKVAGGPVLATPAIVGDRTFVSGCDSTMHILDAATGTEQNSVNLDGQTGSSGAVVGDKIYVGTMNNELLAIDWQKAQIAWRFQPAKNAKPFFASAAATDSFIYAGSRDKRVYGLDRSSGKQAWSFPTDGHVDGSPVVAGERLYAPSLDGSLYVLDRNTGQLVQKLALGKDVSASPAVAGNRLVIGTTDGVLYCLGDQSKH